MKLCECGCGLPAPLAPYNDASREWRKGEPLRFVRGHNGAVHNRKHGECAGDNNKRRSAEYSAWRAMKARCYNQDNPDYANYGGRGIAVCERWRHDFNAFLSDMGPRPSTRHSLDRIDSNGPYSSDNCRWATPTQQVRGRRKAVVVTVRGETLPLAEWARRIGVRYGTLWARAKTHGYERAVLMGRGPNEVDIDSLPGVPDL